MLPGKFASKLSDGSKRGCNSVTKAKVRFPAPEELGTVEQGKQRLLRGSNHEDNPKKSTTMGRLKPVLKRSEIQTAANIPQVVFCIDCKLFISCPHSQGPFGGHTVTTSFEGVSLTNEVVTAIAARTRSNDTHLLSGGSKL